MLKKIACTLMYWIGCFVAVFGFIILAGEDVEHEMIFSDFLMSKVWGVAVMLFGILVSVIASNMDKVCSIVYSIICVIILPFYEMSAKGRRKARLLIKIRNHSDNIFEFMEEIQDRYMYNIEKYDEEQAQMKKNKTPCNDITYC